MHLKIVLNMQLKIIVFKEGVSSDFKLVKISEVYSEKTSFLIKMSVKLNLILSNYPAT